MPEVHLKDGTLSAYGFACGYQNTATNGNDYKRIYSEDGVYHVVSIIATVKTWDTFDQLQEARKHYRAIKLPVTP